MRGRKRFDWIRVAVVATVLTVATLMASHASSSLRDAFPSPVTTVSTISTYPGPNTWIGIDGRIGLSFSMRTGALCPRL